MSTFSDRSNDDVQGSDIDPIPDLVDVETQPMVPESDRTLDMEQYLVILIRGRRVRSLCTEY